MSWERLTLTGGCYIGKYGMHSAHSMRALRACLRYLILPLIIVRGCLSNTIIKMLGTLSESFLLATVTYRIGPRRGPFCKYSSSGTFPTTNILALPPAGRSVSNSPDPQRMSFLKQRQVWAVLIGQAAKPCLRHWHVWNSIIEVCRFGETIPVSRGPKKKK